MKPDTFDIPAYKFGIVKIDYAMSYEEHQLEDYQHELLQGRCTIIPFENIDGLTVEEVKSMLKIKEAHFAAYTSYETGQGNNDIRYINIILRMHAKAPLLEEYADTPIDYIVEKMFEECYGQLNSIQKRVCNCFFERYRDKSHQDTIERIKKLGNRK